MDFLELSKKRESCRSFSSKEVSREDLTQIVEIATNSASACNSQPWKFVVCNGETAKKIPDCIIRDDLKINLWTTEVSSFVIVCETEARLMRSLNKPSQYYAQMDIGMVSMTLCLAAADKNLSTCVIGVFDEEKLKALLEIPEDAKVRSIIAVGYGNDVEPRAKVRKPIEEVLSFNKW